MDSFPCQPMRLRQSAARLLAPGRDGLVLQLWSRALRLCIMIERRRRSGMPGIDTVDSM